MTNTVSILEKLKESLNFQNRGEVDTYKVLINSHEHIQKNIAIGMKI